MIKKVALGISGGVDSAVAALLLKTKGFDVQGVFMQNWDIADETGRCSADEDFKDAAEVCYKLNIKLHHINFVKEYWNEVFCNLVKEYEMGCTPNPDILCNRNIKFNYFYNFAINNLNADAIATGHYAKTTFGPYLESFEPNKAVKLLKARDATKDQTFFLCQIRQEALKRTMFPLGNLMKWQVKHTAIENDLEKFAYKRESMGICFIGSRNFKSFIKEYVSDKPGNFVNVDDAEVMGHHNGIHQWTLGQRTKLAGKSDAFFTAKKNPEDNTIYVAKGTRHPILYSSLILTSKPHWISCTPTELNKGEILECEFKFQHTQDWVSCEVCETHEGLIVKLLKPKRAITAGQYAVFSKGEECLGSAKITNSCFSNFSVYYLKNINTNDTNVLNRHKRIKPSKIQENLGTEKLKSVSY